MASNLRAKAQSARAHYDLTNYILPKLNILQGARLRIAYDDVPADSLVTITDHFEQDGKLSVKVNSADKQFVVPISSIHKYTHPTERTNEGFSYEDRVISIAHSVGIMKTEKTAGCSMAPDAIFYAADGTSYQVELKNGFRAIGGQTVLHHNGEWQLSPRCLEKFPRYAECIRNATVNGEAFLDVLNDRARNGEDAYISSDWMDMSPVLAFQRDKGTDIFHVEGTGTYAISEKASFLPLPEGKVCLRARKKHPGTITVQIDFKVFEKSSVHFDLLTESGLREVMTTYFGYDHDHQRT